MSRGRVCFVCGSLGAEVTLHTKPHDKLPYFPFLEHHDPPKGSRIPGNDGVVDSCRVCYAFLTQQWETYERSRTPAIKRLYWLKRMDNGHFTGAEMRLQGEYIAQVMGLQYQPGVFEGGQSPNASREGGSPNYQDERDICSYGKEKPVFTSQVDNKPFRQEARLPQINSMYANAPAVPTVSLSQRQTQRNFNDGALDLSVSKKPNANKSSSQDCDVFICYICAKEHEVSKSKLINSCLQPTKEPYFPIIEKIPMPSRSLPLTSSGQARVCVTCKNSLYQQWQAYEMSGIPIQHRTYKLYEDFSHVNRHIESRPNNDISSEFGSQSSNMQHVCYICGHLNQEENVRLLYTVPPKDPSFGTLFFPFVRDLRRPHGAQPLKSDGTVLVCKSCYGGIYQQWQAQELSGIPLQHRQYSLSFLRKKVNENFENYAKEKKEVTVNYQDNDKGPPSSSSSDVSQPLNIQISENTTNGESSSHINSGGSQGLLAIATPSVGNTTAESNPSVNAGLVARRGSGDSRANPATVPVPHPLQQATELPKRICFLCGEESLVTKAHILCSYPPRHETKGSNSQVVPFFPFLANRDAALGSEPMSDDGTVISCNFCFSSLLRQWNEQEESKNPENNRWLRKYALPDFVCFVCAKNIKRKNVRPLELKNFPFLREHKFPQSALLLDGGEHVAACKSCTYSLMHQFNEFERMGVPKEMRKYNWMQSGQGDDENSKDNQEEDSNENSNKSCTLNVDEESNDGADEGLPPGSKPPPLTMISPAGSKLSRNTATVPPLNQVSPSNGVNSVAASAALNASRTSSFAAALRKLAQAKDPAEEGSVKQSGSTSTSPRATTPKRGPPPLVYTTQSSTSLTSPPVVTIAPTQSHPSIVSADMRQSLDRAHSVQSSVSSAYDQPLGLKQERTERPQSTHSNSRDDDRLSVKDLQNSRSSRMTPHSGHRSSSPTGGLRDEAVVRGFQPYRPGDDVRHSLPPTYGLDPSAYPYPAFLPPHPFPHPAFRFDDPLLLERYRMMQPHYLPFGHPGLLPPTSVHPFLAGGRYPAELLHQQLPFASQASTLPDQIAAVLTERQRQEEERLREYEREREREKEREAILLREKEKARDREKEYDKERSKEQYQQQHSVEHRTEKKIDHTVDRENHKERVNEREFQKDVSYERTVHNNRDRGSEPDRYPHQMSDTQRSRSESGGIVEHRSRSDDDISRRFGSITQGTPRDSSYGERSTIPLPSNISEQYYNSNKRKEEKIHYNHVKGQSSQKAVNLDLIKQEYERDKRYNDRECSRSNHSNNDLLQKSGKNTDNFFRPFDTILTNGFSGSDVSAELEKYSATQKLDDHKRHSDKTKTSHVEPFYHRQPSEELTKTNPSSHDQNSSSEFSIANYLSHMKQIDLQHSNRTKDFKHLLSQKNSSSHNLKHQESYIKKEKENLESQLVSKLDLDEKVLKEKRAQSDYVSDSDSDSDDSTEERRQVRLMMITNGPPLQLDESKTKLNFFTELGLTSFRVKKELEYEKFRKRRKFHRERSISPVDSEPPDRTASPLRIPPDEKSDDLCREQDFPDKCSFLGSFSLGCIESSKKKELQQIRSVCDNERTRRLSGQMSDNSTGHGCKRKLDKSSDSECEISTKICLKSSEHNAKLSADTQKQNNSGHVTQSVNPDSSSKTVLFPDHSDHKVLSREFAQEFHESVLQTTRQKEINNRLGLGHYRPQDNTDSTLNPSSLTRTNDMIGSSRSHDHATDKYKWPGMEVLLGAYQRHLQEQNLEKKILIDRCRQLQNENKDLNRMAESLSRKMADLMENKRLVDQSRNSCQSAIENIKKNMKALR